jgi:hypothetical protein
MARITAAIRAPTASALSALTSAPAAARRPQSEPRAIAAHAPAGRHRGAPARWRSPSLRSVRSAGFDVSIAMRLNSTGAALPFASSIGPVTGSSDAVGPSTPTVLQEVDAQHPLQCDRRAAVARLRVYRLDQATRATAPLVPPRPGTPRVGSAGHIARNSPSPGSVVASRSAPLREAGSTDRFVAVSSEYLFRESLVEDVSHGGHGCAGACPQPLHRF